MADLFIEAVTGAIASSSDFNANLDLLEASLQDLGPFVISGLTVSAGAGLDVSVASGVASIGGRVVAAGSFAIMGLTPSTVNHLYMLRDGTGTSNTTGTQPANSVKLGTATTDGSSVTAVGQGWASGRQTKRRPEDLVHGSGAGHPRAVDLASWHATNDEGNEVKGTLAAGAISLAFDDLADVVVAGAAHGAIAYKDATNWEDLPPGTSGEFLQTLGSGADPQWATPDHGALSGLSDDDHSQYALADKSRPTPWVSSSDLAARIVGDLGDTALGSAAQGDVIYRNGSSQWARLPAGTSGMFLQTLGAGANPQWATPDHGALSGLSDDDHSQYIFNAPATSARNVVQPTAADAVPLTLKGHASQSVPLQEWQTSAGSVVGSLDATGALAAGRGEFAALDPDLDVLRVRGHASQVAELLYVENSSFVQLFVVDATGIGLHRQIDAGTTDQVVTETFHRTSTGTPGNNFGSIHRRTLRSSTTGGRTVLDEEVRWVDATDASRKARATFSVYDTAAREALRMEASGSAPLIGFLGAAAVARTSAYTVTNLTTDRSYDANATSTAELADVLGTLIADLKAFGLLG